MEKENQTENADHVGSAALLAKIGRCRVCGVEPVGEEFRGHKGGQVTHAHSQNGWWLVVTHHQDIYREEKTKSNRVDNLLCSVCKVKHDYKMGQLLDEMING